MPPPVPGMMLWPHLTVQDVDATLAFYRDRLGFEQDLCLKDPVSIVLRSRCFLRGAARQGRFGIPRARQSTLWQPRFRDPRSGWLLPGVCEGDLIWSGSGVHIHRPREGAATTDAAKARVRDELCHERGGVYVGSEWISGQTAFAIQDSIPEAHVPRVSRIREGKPSLGVPQGFL